MKLKKFNYKRSIICFVFLFVILIPVIIFPTFNLINKENTNKLDSTRGQYIESNNMSETLPIFGNLYKDVATENSMTISIDKFENGLGDYELNGIRVSVNSLIDNNDDGIWDDFNNIANVESPNLENPRFFVSNLERNKDYIILLENRFAASNSLCDTEGIADTWCPIMGVNAKTFRIEDEDIGNVKISNIRTLDITKNSVDVIFDVNNFTSENVSKVDYKILDVYTNLNYRNWTSFEGPTIEDNAFSINGLRAGREYRIFLRLNEDDSKISSRAFNMVEMSGNDIELELRLDEFQLISNDQNSFTYKVNTKLNILHQLDIQGLISRITFSLDEGNTFIGEVTNLTMKFDQEIGRNGKWILEFNIQIPNTIESSEILNSIIFKGEDSSGKNTTLLSGIDQKYNESENSFGGGRKFSGGAIAGIVIGSIVGFIILILLIRHFVKKKKKNKLTKV